MLHPYGSLHYGLLHRDVLKISVENDFSKAMHRFYGWYLVSSNPFSGEVYGYPNVSDVSSLLRTSKQSIYNFRDMFVDLNLVTQEVGSPGLKGVVRHIPIARAEIKAQRLLKEEAKPQHPYANNIAGKIPREFVRIAVEQNLDKFSQRHFWYISCNLAKEGHLTRLEEIDEIARIIGTTSTMMVLRSFKTLEKTELFKVNQPTTIQGICQPIVDTVAAAAEQREQQLKAQVFRKTMNAFLKRQATIYSSRHKIEGVPGNGPKPPQALVQEMKKAFRDHYDETGEFLTSFFD